MGDDLIWRDPENDQFCSRCNENNGVRQVFRNFEEGGESEEGWVCLICVKQIDGYSCYECGKQVEFDETFWCENCQDLDFGTCQTCWEKIGGYFDGISMHNVCGEECK